MTRRAFLGALPAAAALAVSGSKPNVILIMTDDQGWFDLGVNGNPVIETPNIDRLAAEGVRFSHFYCSPVCSPTRAALMTGRHYQRTGCVDTYLGRDVLDAEEVTLGDVMKQQGYRTGCVGKWHLGRYMKYHPNHRGFDEYFGFWQYGFINRYDDSDELFHNKRPVEATGYITDVLTDQAIRFVDANKSRPFFLYLPLNAPHAPFLAPDRYIEPYLKNGVPLTDARIYGMVTAIDENIGRLLGTVDKAGLRENTIVVFMTDNGGVSHHQKAGLRGNKGSVYEGGVRVPFIVRWPGQIPAGKTVSAMAQHIDVLPTICELAGAPLPTGRKLDGKSVAPILRTGAGESPHEFVFHQWNRGRPVLETEPGDPELKANWAVCSKAGIKLLANGELYDLKADPGEARNIAASRPDDADRLRREFESFYKDVTAGRDYKRVPIEVGRDDENPVEIDLTWGEPVGSKVRPQYRHYNRDTIDNWSVAGEAVRWKIDITRPGDYEVIFKYGCDPGQEGSVVRVSVAGKSLDHTIRATAGKMVFEPVRIGSLDLPKGPATFEVKAVRISGNELMTVHKIWLRRMG